MARKRPLVLVVEDDPALGDVITTALRDDGLESKLASDGDEAMRLVDELEPSVMVLDLMMPRRDGFSVLRELRSDGRIDLRCREVVDPDGRWSEATIEDTGVGIPADQLDRIFEPFVQGDTGYTRAHGGVGLGLAISRRLARMMGGELTARSAAGQGSVFTLRLPAGGPAHVLTMVDPPALTR